MNPSTRTPFMTIAFCSIATMALLASVGSAVTGDAEGPEKRDPAKKSDASLIDRAKAVIEKALKKYRTANTYQDTIRFKTETVAKDADGDDASPGSSVICSARGKKGLEML